MPLDEHFSPAACLIRNAKTVEGDSSAVMATLDRAETLFRAVNDAVEIE
jgi:hypothetical protein